MFVISTVNVHVSAERCSKRSTAPELTGPLFYGMGAMRQLCREKRVWEPEQLANTCHDVVRLT